MIREVNEIPKPNTKHVSDKPVGYYRELIRADIKEAYSKKIKIFEFIGYDAKPDYIVQAARDESYIICRELIYLPAKNYARKKLEKEFKKTDFIRCIIPTKYSPNNIIKIRGVTLEDGIKHVYCEINYTQAAKFKKQFLEHSRELTSSTISRLSKKQR